MKQDDRPINWFLVTCFALLVPIVLLAVAFDDRGERLTRLERVNEDLKRDLRETINLHQEAATERDFLVAEVRELQTRVKSSESALEREKTANRASRSHTRTTPLRIAPTQDGLNWAALRMCENGGSYRSRPSDRYRGAYQFDQRTWDGVALRHVPQWRGKDPASAPPGVQDQFARWLYSERGRQPWPTCGRRL